jgi:NAD(P)-dependent dehydrogenase (short-subunit alcohol dehydrogenase family)
MSTVRVCQHALPLMLARKTVAGRIIIISSESGVKPHPYMLHYSMTKAAQIR